MDRVQMLLVGLPVFLFCSDILNLFTLSPPPKPSHQHHQHHPHHPQPVVQPTPDFPSQKTVGGGGIGYGNTINIGFCSSCSYGGTAKTITKMLETSFPGIDVILANHPPKLPKRLLSKVVPVVQVGVIGILMAGEHIFPRLGFMTPPPWYFSLRANRFGTIASTWLLGNVVQSFLQSSGAFEVYCNGELVFSKLKEQRFPSEFELRELVSQKLGNSRIVDAGGVWSH
ncbi:selT-like protein isoform X1 [Telopea speciosissima]|uniref:selT-like protein isoform X1 n=1 Tax=Telopea speciosissima TaxID=54955 RepID=UPI001CC5574D|nr:selT-like protein isoform X1 [Telopea speciosissima]XP_043723964.1 selT-like protein isoform X2 [Telopea speciosissima]XP_043723965.1 selT-like protein isoform X1 [Telopea speciosissima]